MDEISKYYNNKFYLVSQLISVLYDLDGCGSGGLCHIVVDENNIDDDSLDVEIEFCNKDENNNRIEKDLCILICNTLKEFTLLQRETLFEMMDYGFYDGYDKYDVVDYLSIKNKI